MTPPFLRHHRASAGPPARRGVFPIAVRLAVRAAVCPALRFATCPVFRLALRPVLRLAICLAGPSAIRLAAAAILISAPLARSGEPPAAPADSSRPAAPAFDEKKWPDVPDSIEVEFGDGRPAVSFAVYKTGEGPYLDLADLARITGGDYVWDPETYRGALGVDSVEVSFTLDAPLFWVPDNVVQTPNPVRYEGESVRLPYAALDQVILPLLGERARWDPKTGRMRIAGPRPWLEKIELDRERSRVRLRVSPLGAWSHRVRWDPSGLLTLEIRGLYLPPDFQPPSPRVRGVEHLRVLPTPSGLVATLFLEPGWSGVRSREETGEGLFSVELTKSMQEVDRGSFDLLSSYQRPPGTTSEERRRILIEVSTSGPITGPDRRYLENLSEQLRSQLEDRFGHEVILVPDRKAEGRIRGPRGLPEMPGVPAGDCWIGLRLESYPSSEARDFLLVFPGQAPRMMEVSSQLAESGAPLPASGGGQVTAPPPRDGRGGSDPGVRMVPWGQVPRLFRAASERLAGILADHLEGELKFRPVRRVSRPARVFRGVGMPAVLIYPAVEADRTGLRALSAPDQVEGVARSLAFGIDEFLLEWKAR